MTLVAPVKPGGSCKLTTVFIFVAVGTFRELDFELGRFARRKMAGCALDLRMGKDQRETRPRVIRHRKRRGLPSLHGMAAFAPSAVRTIQELPSMRIGLVAIGTLAVGYGRLEIRSPMTGDTCNLEVHAGQWKGSLGVIKSARKSCCPPGGSGVAGAALLLESALVRIAMTISTT